MNTEDDGEVELNIREPQVGSPVLASLTDDDGTIRGQSLALVQERRYSDTTNGR